MSIESGYKIDNYREQTAQHKELYLAPCGDLNEKEVQREGAYLYLWLIQLAVL